LKKRWFTLILALSMATVCQVHFEYTVHFEEAGTKAAEEAQSAEVEFESWQEADRFFKTVGYDLEKGIVPRVFLKSLPSNMSEIPEVGKKKELFIKILLPIILEVNEEIEKERQEITTLSDNSQKLLHYMKKYRANSKEELLEKVQPIPVEIAIAQAAIESAWGTSRFAIEGNNIFGEWTFTPGSGIVPQERPDGEMYEVRAFDSLLDSVRSYAYNLNVSSFYSEFRKIRSGKLHKPIEEGLLYYSERRYEYVNEVKIIISKNNLKSYSTLGLSSVRIALIKNHNLTDNY